MNICDQQESWDHLSHDKRFDEVKAWILEKASDWRLTGVTVVEGITLDASGGRHAGGYNRDTNVITLDPALFEPGSHFETTYDTAAHELGHALNDQVYEDLFPGTGGPDPADDGADMGNDPINSEIRQNYAEDFAKAFMHAVDEQCKGRGTAESPANRARDEVGEPPGPLGDWELPADEEVTFG